MECVTIYAGSICRDNIKFVNTIYIKTNIFQFYEMHRLILFIILFQL